MERKRRIVTWRRGLIASLLIIGIAFAVLRLATTSDFLFLPNKTRLVAPLVIVPGEAAPPEVGGIYMVDISVKSATLFDQLFPGLNGDATLVDGELINPQGLSDEQREERSALQMTSSQEISAAVALRALGYDVEIVDGGALVQRVASDGGSAGILVDGDIIVGVNGTEIATVDQLLAQLAPVTPGDTVTLQLRRTDGLEEVSIETRQHPEDAERALIGIEAAQAGNVDIPIDIEIDTSNIGGPSAGLAFALDIVDELGPDLDAGRTIVVTGALELDGSVGRVGGVKQKAVSARKLGADLFIVPAGNEEAARETAGSVEVIAVESFDEALEAITGEPVSALALGELTDEPAAAPAG